jgi:CRISPR-associated protein Cst2
MSLHIFGNILSGYGCAANNRGESEGNITTLQKLLWKGDVHTTVSSEAIRWALRYYWQTDEIEVNRRWDDEKDDHVWTDETWKGWADEKGKTYIDDDLLGYMKAEGGKKEGEKGSTSKRRGVLEISRAISTTPYAGDISFNARSGEKGRTSLYGAEIHATRYQYGFSMTPERLREKNRCLNALDAISGLCEVAGNHSRFLYDFSPESIVLRVSEDPAPRILYCFQEKDGNISVNELVRKVEAEDISKDELFIGGLASDLPEVKALGLANCFPGVKKTVEECKKIIRDKLEIKDM